MRVTTTTTAHASTYPAWLNISLPYTNFYLTVAQGLHKLGRCSTANMLPWGYIHDQVA
ncbi:hypothetical protein VM1G_11271 [Cytospora mali]|uniref:Uncharacterized protein n=1 Tax=Cytospora mali TaxID=578113 RepID=A0A194VLI9_CYTMA|nr:hypothetical protein VM1G_11271 [Valsa mali]